MFFLVNFCAERSFSPHFYHAPYFCLGGKRGRGGAGISVGAYLKPQDPVTKKEDAYVTFLVQMKLFIVKSGSFEMFRHV